MIVNSAIRKVLILMNVFAIVGIVAGFVVVGLNYEKFLRATHFLVVLPYLFSILVFSNIRLQPGKWVAVLFNAMFLLMFTWLLYVSTGMSLHNKDLLLGSLVLLGFIPCIVNIWYILSLPPRESPGEQ